MILSTGSAYLFCPIELEISANSAIQLDISAIQGINVKTGTPYNWRNVLRVISYI